MGTKEGTKKISQNEGRRLSRLRGATVARLTPDQKVACSNHVAFNNFLFA